LIRSLHQLADLTDNPFHNPYALPCALAALQFSRNIKQTEARRQNLLTSYLLLANVVPNDRSRLDFLNNAAAFRPLLGQNATPLHAQILQQTGHSLLGMGRYLDAIEEYNKIPLASITAEARLGRALAELSSDGSFDRSTDWGDLSADELFSYTVLLGIEAAQTDRAEAANYFNWAVQPLSNNRSEAPFFIKNQNNTFTNLFHAVLLTQAAQAMHPIHYDPTWIQYLLSNARVIAPPNSKVLSDVLAAEKVIQAPA